MTPATLKRIVTTWQKRLKIEHITIDIQFGVEPEDEDALASVSPSDLYDYAAVRFRGDWPERTVQEINRIVVHELLHIMFRDFSQAARSICITGEIPGSARALWYDRCNDAEEGLIDRLANRLVEGFGVVE